MRLETRDFGIPILLTALMLGIITYWAWQTWYAIDDRGIGKAQHDALKTSDILLSSLCALDRSGKLNREEIEQRFAPILDAASCRFLVLLRDGKRAFEVGGVPAELPASFGESPFSLGGTFVLPRKVLMPYTPSKGPSRSPVFGAKASGSGIFNGEYMLVLGRDEIQGRTPPKKLFGHIIVPFVAVLLILVANAAAWVMVIRNRSLFEQLEMERTRSAHLEDLGLAAAGLAHETKNPLGIISGIAQQVARDPQVPEKSRAMIETIIDEIDKSVSRLGLFMTFAGTRKVIATAVDVLPLIEGIAEVLKPELDAAGVSLEIECPALTVMADEGMFRQILVNLILNSLAASTRGETITIRLICNGSHTTAEVEDRGCGIPKELLPRIFKPYVTGKPDGHGLGLSIVKRFAEDHSWSVSAESRPGQGTTIRISGISNSGITGDAK